MINETHLLESQFGALFYDIECTLCTAATAGLILQSPIQFLVLRMQGKIFLQGNDLSTS